MLKPIREVSEEERNKRALLVLHGLSLAHDFDLVSEDLLANRAKKLWDDIYIITHSVIGCSAKECPVVKDGIIRIEELEVSLKVAKIIDVERELLGHTFPETPEF